METVRRTVLPVIAGFLGAFVTMMVFEYTNSLLFPFPDTMDLANIDQLREFTATYAPHIFVLVWCGWVCGSIIAGYITTFFSHEHIYRRSAFVGVLLTLMGIANHLMLEHPLWFNIIGLPVFIIGTYVGHRLARASSPSL